MNRPAPSVGTVENGYRFKGGDPAQESSWEQVGVIDVSDTYGAGARQLPNGRIERVGPRGGVEKIGTAGGGNSDSSALVGADARARFMLGLGPLKAAQGNLADLERDGNPLNHNWGAALLDQATEVPFLRNIGDSAARMWGGDDYGRYTQAAASYESALLPIMSGAAVTPSEAQRIIRADLPQLGDSPEVLRRKAENRAMRINGVAKGIGEEAPFLPTIEEGDNGLPSYPAIGRLTADIQEYPVPEGGYGPRPGDVVTTTQPLAPDDTPASLAAQGYVYDATRDTWSRTRQVQAPTAQESVNERRNMDGVTRRLDAGVRGAADMLSFGFADEAAALGDAIIPLTAGSRSLWSDGFGAAFNHNLDLQRGLDRSDGRDVPVSRGVGQAAGVGLGIGAALSKSGAQLASRLPAFLQAEARPLGQTRFVPEVLRRTRNGVRAGLFGGTGAAVAAAGENNGNIPERVAAGARAAPFGAALGAGAAPVINTVAQPVGLFARRVMNRPPALDDLVRRLSVPENAAEQASALRAQGLAPTITDLADDAGRGQLRALATRQTPARQAARDFSEGRATDLQDRLSVQARRNVSDDPRSPLQMRDEITQRRAAEADEAFGAVRLEPVMPDRAVVDALRAPATRSAIEEAATASLNRGDGETAHMLQQLVDGALDNPNGVQMTVGMADRISRSLNGRAEGFQRSGNNDAAASFFSLAERLRGAARQQVPGYDAALRAYSTDSRLADAIDLGERFLNMEADEFAAAAARLSPEERAIAQAAARRAIERAAGTQGAAPGVARRLSAGREQQARNAALLDDPQTFQRAVGMEHQAVQNAGAINPMRGSPTAPSMQDALQMAGEAIGTVRDVAGGNVPGLMNRVANDVKTMGFNDQEAEMLVMAAIDPNQTDRVLAILTQAVGPERAQAGVLAAKFAILQNTGEDIGSR